MPFSSGLESGFEDAFADIFNLTSKTDFPSLCHRALGILIVHSVPSTWQRSGVFILSFTKSQCSPAEKDYFPLNVWSSPFPASLFKLLIEYVPLPWSIVISWHVQWHAINNPCLYDCTGFLPKLHSQKQLTHFSELSLFSQYGVEKAGRLDLRKFLPPIQ